MNREQRELLERLVRDVEVSPMTEGYHPVKLRTNRGNIESRYYQVTGAQQAALWVGGVGGGWDTPAKGLYPLLCEEFVSEGIASMRVRYRYPTLLKESILDVLASLELLQNEGIKVAALIGHSFGGAVVISAAANSPIARTVVTLATQSYGAATASLLQPNCSLLLLHGTGDEVLSPSCSEYIYQLAHQPKHLILYPGVTHNLNEAAPEVQQVVGDWVRHKLNEAVRASL